MKLLQDILMQMQGIGKSRKNFLITLFKTVFSMSGRMNFLNMSRYSSLSEKTFSRNFRRDFDFTEFNGEAIRRVYDPTHTYMLASDASFIPKSGKVTYGLGRFWNGIQSRHLKGLEISNYALVDITARSAYTLKVDQVPPSQSNTKESAIDFFLSQLKDLKNAKLEFPLPRHLAVDGAYSKKKFIDGATAQGIHTIGRLRKDANLKYLYQVPKSGKKRRGRPRKFNGKIDCKNPDLTQIKFVIDLNEHLSLYSGVVYSVSLKRNIKLLYLKHTAKSGKRHYLMLFSTDLEMDAHNIYTHYTSRFQIEFIFRDAKQHTGLTHCQARNKKSLHFHFNMSLTALNLARIEHQLQNPQAINSPFSMASYKRRQANEMMLELFLSKLDIRPNLHKIRNVYQEILNFGAIAA